MTITKSEYYVGEREEEFDDLVARKGAEEDYLDQTQAELTSDTESELEEEGHENKCDDVTNESDARLLRDLKKRTRELEAVKPEESGPYSDFFQMKEQALLGYTTLLGFLVLLRAKKKDTRGHPANRKLVRYRMILDKLLPMEKRIRAKLLEEEEKPQASNIVFSDEENAEEATEYSPPKIAPAYQHEKKKISESESSSPSANERELEEFEEENFTRIKAKKKKEKKKEKKTKEDIEDELALLDEMLTGVDGSEESESGDEGNIPSGASDSEIEDDLAEARRPANRQNVPDRTKEYGRTSRDRKNPRKRIRARFDKKNSERAEKISSYEGKKEHYKGEKGIQKDISRSTRFK